MIADGAARGGHLVRHESVGQATIRRHGHPVAVALVAGESNNSNPSAGVVYTEFR